MLTSAHGAIAHNHDSNHHHEDHSHDQHSHDHHKHNGNHLIKVTHGIFHSVVHFIENLSHNHDASNEPIFIENPNLRHHICGASISFAQQETLLEYSPKCYSSESISRYSKIYLINSSLRGPPTIV